MGALAWAGAPGPSETSLGERCLAHHLSDPVRAGRFAGMSVTHVRQRADDVIVTLERISIRHLNVERTVIVCDLSDLGHPIGG